MNRLGVPEYWIVDFLGLGGRDYVGNPKQPILTLCTLQGHVYQKQPLREDDQLASLLFPDLALTVEQIFAAGR